MVRITLQNVSTAHFRRNRHDTTPATQKETRPRGTPVRYVYGNDPNTITVQEINTTRYRTVCTADFRPYPSHYDPCHSPKNAFKTQTKKNKIHIRPNDAQRGRRLPGCSKMGTSPRRRTRKTRPEQNDEMACRQPTTPLDRLILLKMT